MKNKRDIQSFEDIQQLVNAFYDKIRKDQLLGPIFNGIIQDNWPVHLEKMHRFWQTVLLKEPTYTGSPFAPHAKMPIGKEHFNHWLAHFTETVHENFDGPKAAEAVWRANKMAQMFQTKLHYHQNEQTKPIF